MKPVDQHLADCLDVVDQLPPMDVSLVDALDCVLTLDVHSRVSLPPFDNSSMDGYAVVAEDVAGAIVATLTQPRRYRTQLWALRSMFEES